MTKLKTINCSNEECGKEFKQRKPTSQYCSVECVKEAKSSKNPLDRICLNKDCKQQFSVQRRSDKKKYCSRSCAVKTNNHIYPKRSPEGKCFVCEKTIPSNHKYCEECRKQALSRNGKKSKNLKLNNKNNMIKQCFMCGKDFNTKFWNAKYCTDKCKDNYKNYINNKKCTKCEKPISVNSKTGYCSKCASEIRTEKYIQKWLETGILKNKNGKIAGSIRTYLLEQANYACEECGFNKPHPVDGKSILEVDHINGNSEDNRRENLKVLCPTCHAMTPTYRNRNAGNGRTNRYKNKKDTIKSIQS